MHIKLTYFSLYLAKGKQNCWVGRVWIAEELFRYSHPFILSNLITKKLTKHEVEVQFKVIQIFSSVNIAKTFSFESHHHSIEILNSFLYMLLCF